MHVTIPELAKIDIKQTNTRHVLSEILLNGAASRTQLAERTGLAIATISRTTHKLMESGLLIEKPPTPSPNRSGRRVVELDVNPEGGYIIGISINAFQQVITLGNLKERVAAHQLLNLSPSKSPKGVLLEVVNIVRKLMLENNIGLSSVIGVGVSAAGAVDSEKGIIRWAPTLGWQEVEIGKFLSSELGLEVYVANIPNAMNLAETRFGIGRGFSNVVLLNSALGVGASLFLDNHLIHGNSFRAGVLGGLELLTDDKGNRISIADAAGGWGLIHAYRGTKDKALDPPPAKQLEAIIDLSENGDEKATQAMARVGNYMGRVFELVEGITHPELLVLSGPLSTCRSYVEATRSYLDDVWGRRSHIPDLVISQKSSGEASRLLALQEFLLCR